jgi:hypothetical protein
MAARVSAASRNESLEDIDVLFLAVSGLYVFVVDISYDLIELHYVIVEIVMRLAPHVRNPDRGPFDRPVTRISVPHRRSPE